MQEDDNRTRFFIIFIKVFSSAEIKDILQNLSDNLIEKDFQKGCKEFQKLANFYHFPFNFEFISRPTNVKMPLLIYCDLFQNEMSDTIVISSDEIIRIIQNMFEELKNFLPEAMEQLKAFPGVILNDTEVNASLINWARENFPNAAASRGAAAPPN